MGEKIPNKLRKNRIILRTYRLFRDILLIICKLVILIVPKNKNLFVFTAWFGEKYSDNTMFFYEYLLKKREYNVVWLTNNQDVYNKLIKEKKPVVKSKTLAGVWTQIRAKVLFSTVQLADYNQFLLSRCVYIDLDHGMPFKMAGYTVNTNDNDYLKKHDRIVKLFVDYYMSATSYCCAKMMEYQYLQDFNHMILSGRIRHSLFFNSNMREGLNSSINEIKGNSRLISYLPTHRSGGRKQLDLSKVLDFDKIDQICEANNCKFIIKKHFYHRNEIESVEGYKNIFDLTHDSSLDTQMLLYQTDILISDYSSAFIDFLLLNRPILLYMFDSEEFLRNERGFFVPFEELGLECVYDKNIFYDRLQDMLSPNVDKYINMSKRCRDIFYDKSITQIENADNMLKIVEEILEGKKKQNWEECKDSALSNSFIRNILLLIENACKES